MRNVSVVVVGALALSSSVAVAQPREGAPRKSATTAQVLTGAGIAVPALAMLAGGWLADDLDGIEASFIAGSVGYAVLPAAGQWYAGRIGALGLGVRTAGAAAMIGGFHVFVADEARDGRGIWLLGAGVTAVIGGMVYDFLTVPDSVDDWNEAHAAQLSLIKVPDGYGLGLAGAF